MPGQPVVLDTFGGLVASARPEDIPEGASPRTWDTDFIVGRFIQRAGLKNVYSFQGVDFGPNGAGVATDVNTQNNPWTTPDNILANDGTFASCTTINGLTTNQLWLTNFNFTLPSTTTVTGLVVSPKGFAPGTTVFAQLTKLGSPVGNVKSLTLPTSNAFVSFGGQTDNWGADWDYAAIDLTSFGVILWAECVSTATVAFDYCEIIVYGSEANTNFLGLLSANINSVDLTTLALDANGLIWAEDVTNAPNILVRAGVIPEVVPGSYMKGVDAAGIAYMAYSDLTQGTSQPMQFNGQWCDRITQIGPGQAPTFTPQQASSDTFGISTITQLPQQSRTSSYFLQSSGVGVTDAGNNVTIYYDDSTVGGGHPDTALIDAFNSGNPVYIYVGFTGTGIPTQGPYVVQVTSVGLAPPPGQPRPFNYFTYTLPTSSAQYYQGSGHPTYTVTYQQSLATLTTSVPVPGLTVSSEITIAGATPSGWNGPWTITQLLNSGSISITQTAASGGVVTYTYTLVNGVAPSGGQLVTITNTLNDNGLLNGANLTIVSATGGSSGSFTVSLGVPDATAVSENGQGVTAGTIFAFDPGAALVGSPTNPIFGNGTGGTLTFAANSATFITPGVKQGSIFWITRNGAVTFPANPTTFTVPVNTQSISATNVLIGPPNVIARGVIFTESGQNGVPGANFYTYDTPVTFTVNGIDYIASALIIPDNTSTSATFSFPDSVLLASDEIDIQGNNYFNLREIGSATWIFQYASRMMYGLCQTKIDNFWNLTFDGGFLPTSAPQPSFWTPVVPPSGIDVRLVNSPDFGNCLQILNSTGSTVTGDYLYYQTAYQDFYNVNILQPNTAYSVRFKARALNADNQQITLAMVPYTGAFGVPRGTVNFTVDQGEFTIQTAQIIGEQDTIDPNLKLAIQIGSITAGAGVQIDRIEIFPTNHPVDTTTIWTSYVDKFESVDRVTGQLGCGADNPQPAQGAYQILEQLYIEKTASRCVTQDSPNYEPNQWNVPLASQGVGAIGPNAFYAEEEFSISANRSGLFLFDGGKPMPISRELQSTGVNGSIWEKINFAAAKTIWVRFSTDKRQLYVGVPMITPNFWLPNAPASTPTSPNIVIMCNFTGCATAEELASSAPVHTTMFGDLKSLDMRRKWSLWQMVIPVSEFIARQDGVSTPLFLCNGTNTSKIYQLQDGAPHTGISPITSSGQNTDDGKPINWLYTTYAFTKAKQGQQVPGLGALRKVWYYFAATMEGTGQVARKFYSNTLGALSQNTYTAPPATLSYPAQNDQECVLEIGGQRLFVELSAVSNAFIAPYAEVGPIILDGEMDKNAPHRGVSS